MTEPTPAPDLLQLAEPGDAEALVDMRDSAAAWMLAEGISQWRPGEVGLRWYRRLIAAGSVWVLRSDGGSLAASVCVLWDDPTVWGELSEPAGYIHGLMIERQRAGRGLGVAVLAWAEAHIAANGRPIARLDCVATNTRLRSYYEAAGYSLVRTREYPDQRWSPSALFEKRIERRVGP